MKYTIEVKLENGDYQSALDWHFDALEEAEKLLRTLNFEKLNGKQIVEIILYDNDTNEIVDKKTLDRKKTNKERDIEFIKSFKEISIVRICEKLGVDRFNLVHEKTSPEATHKVAVELLKWLEECIKDYND